MLFEMDWINAEKTILHVTLPKQFTWDEQHQAVREVSAEIASVPQMVHLIVSTDGSRMPRGNPFPHFRFLVRSLPQNTGAVIIVGAGQYERTILYAFLKVTQTFGGTKSYVVDTMDEALALLQADDANV